MQKYVHLIASAVIALLCGFIAYYKHNTVIVLAFITWNALIYSYIFQLWYIILKTPQQHIAAMAVKFDQTLPVVLGCFCFATTISIFASIYTLSAAHTGLSPLGDAIIIASTIVGAWVLLATLFTIHYAHLFYLNKSNQPILLFPDKIKDPHYLDFAYFSYTLSIAGQTADIALSGTCMRSLVLLHCVLAFVFNSCILGLSVNLLAGLVK